MRITPRANINRARLAKIAKATADLPEQAVTLRGRVLVGVMRTISSPHFGASMAETRKKNSPGIRSLKERISRSIAGVATPSDIKPYGRPVRTKKGGVIALSFATGKKMRPQEFRGEFGFVVVPSTRGRRRSIAPMADPAEVYARARLRRTSKGAMKYAPAPRKVSYISANKLAAFVRKQQKHAGKYVSGWAPAARFFFRGQSIAAGYFAEHRSPGSARMVRTGARAAAYVSNLAAHSGGQASRHQTAFKSHGLRMAKHALAKVDGQLRKWYRTQTRRTS